MKEVTKLAAATAPGCAASNSRGAAPGSRYQWRGASAAVQRANERQPSRHIAKSSANISRMTRSTARSTRERLDGGCVEFMKILVSWPFMVMG